MGRRCGGRGGVGWGVGRKVSVDVMGISHSLAEMAVHDCQYVGSDGLACLLDDDGLGCCKSVEVGADVLHFVGVAWAEGMVVAVVGVIVEIASGREELFVVPSLH